MALAMQREKDAAGTRDPVMFLNLPIQRRTTADMVEQIEQHIERKQTLDIAFCNANTLLLAHDDPTYLETLSQMTLLNDGIGSDIAARMLTGHPFAENLNGTDFIPALLQQSTKKLRLFLLGAKPDVVEKAAETFSSDYPQHAVVGFKDGYFEPKNLPDIFSSIKDAKADILLVAMGNPAQEKFIRTHRDHLKVPVTMGVGALFDFTANIFPRAPLWMQRAKLEWLFRLSQEPKRLLHRYTIGIARFLWITWKQRGTH